MKENQRILRLTVPFKDIFTTVYAIRTSEGVLVFDTATTAEDVEGFLLPFLKEQKILPDEICGIFLSHSHGDHAGGLPALLPHLPRAKVYSRSKKLAETYPDRVIRPEDGEEIFGGLKTVTIPGHSADSMGVLDTQTGVLLSGDCLQLYGIYGSGAWGSNITLPRLHLQALDKLAALPMKKIYAAHDYHPLGFCYEGKEKIAEALENCRRPLFEIRDRILKAPDRSDEEIAAEISRTLPRLHPRVVAAVREELPFF